MTGPGSWVVGVFLRFQSNGAATMSRLASSVTAANLTLARQQGLIDKNAFAMANYERKIAAANAAFMRAGTMGAGIVAGAGLYGITSAMRDAGKLQQILLSIRNETGASSRQMEGFYQTIFTIANQNGMTPESAGEVMRSISRLTAGQFSVAQMMAIAPTVAGFASTTHFNRPDVGVDAATKTGIATAHLFRAYTPESLTKLLDSVYRLSGLMSESPDQALRQMSYYVPMFKALGIGNESSIATMALLDRAGFRNKVGTNVRTLVLEALGPMQLTQHAQAGKAAILEQMGLFKNGKFAWNNADGTLNFFGELASIGNWAQSQRKKGVPASQIAQEMFGALGKQGGTIGALFMDPQMSGILAGIQKYLKDPNVGLGAGQSNRDLGLNYQFTRALSNFGAVLTELGYPWLEDLTGFFKGIGDSLHGFQAWLHQNRGAEKAIGGILAGFTALFALRFAIGTGQMIIAGAKAMGMLAEAAPGISMGARALQLLDFLFLGGLGARMLTFATTFGVFTAATSSFAAVLGGSAVAGIPAALNAFRLGMLGLATFLASPVALAALATLGLVALSTQGAGTEENTLRKGTGYGSASFWENYAKKHGWKAVPEDVRKAIHIEHVHINLPNVKTAKDAHEIAAVLGDPRSLMGSAPGTARTHPKIPMVLSVGVA